MSTIIEQEALFNVIQYFTTQMVKTGQNWVISKFLAINWMIINKWPALGQNSQFLKAIIETARKVNLNIHPKDGNASVCKNEHWRKQGKRLA